MAEPKVKENNLITGPVFSSIALFALPMLLGNILQQLYNIVDTWVVGRYIGTEALAAVGAVFALMVFLTSVLLGLCMGSGAVFSHDLGRGEINALERRIGTAFLGIAVIAVLITAGSYLLCSLMIRWLNIPVELQEMTRQYMHIIFAGIPAVFVYNFFAGYMKSMGNSIMPLWFLAVSAVTNMILDLLFVLKFQMGVAGAAYATVIAQYLSAVISVGYCIAKDIHIRRAFGGIDIRRDDLRLLGKYSLFTCLQQSVMNLGILMVQGIVNSFGTQVMAAFSAGVKIDAFAYMPAQEYGNAFSTFLAQNHGAGNMERVKKGTKAGMITSTVYCVAASVLLCAAAQALMGIFVDPSQTEVIAIGVEYLRIEGMFYVGIGILFLWYGYFRAIGMPQMSLVLTVISLGTRVAVSYFVSPVVGVTAIWRSIPIGWGLADLVGFLTYMHLKRGFYEGY